MTETKNILKCIGVVTIPILVLSVAMMASSFHVVEEGHVGIYFKQGALQVIENWLPIRDEFELEFSSSSKPEL